MGIHLSKRSFVRILSYTAAAIAVCGGISYTQYKRANDFQMQLENRYLCSLGELSAYLTNIADDLDKGQYVGTSGQLSLMAARVWRESAGAKSALSSLPVSDLQMDNTYRFLSQVGDYAMTISKKVANGGELSFGEEQDAETLRLYAGRLREYVDGIQQQIQDGQLDILALPTTHQGGDTKGSKSNGFGFEDVEQTMTGYPTLIYDGPFSDHLLDRAPRFTRGMEAVTPDDALAIAAEASGLRTSDLTRGDDENSNMPSYTFNAPGITIGVTKAGGVVSYLINDREIGQQRMSIDGVLQRGLQYLEMLGIPDMRATYYETNDGICTVNYASTSGDIILYPDLVKVGVALDDGSIVFYDARGYIGNHRERSFPAPVLTAEEAAGSVNDSLYIRTSRLALIPTLGGNEVLTYEFLCVTEDEQKLLVYVNTENGAEEQIFLLLETPNGTLTK